MADPDRIDRAAVIHAESQRFADVLATTAPDTRCPTCPDWNAADLLWHLTEVHAFWAGILRSDARSDDEMKSVESAKPVRPDAISDMLPVRAAATSDLLAQLAALPDDAPRWSWWPPEQTVGFTRRMQTCEATMHRVDAELTAGLAISPISEAVGVACVTHCVDVMWGWMPDWASYETRAVVEFVASDVERRWLVDVGHWTGTGPESGTSFDEIRATRAQPGSRPAATVTAPATDLALWSWTRGGDVRIDGEPEAVAAVEALIANGIQ